MTSAAKRKGTAYESAIVGFLRDNHNPGAHRNVQTGARDIGDIDGYYLHALEAKAERTITLAEYVRQANRERIHAQKPFACVWVKARGKGVAASYVVRDAGTDVRLMNRLRAAESALERADSAAYRVHVEGHGGGD